MATTEKILDVEEMEAGRELDAQVAERVMGLAWNTYSITGAWPVIGSALRVAETSDRIWRDGSPRLVLCPNYSTDIAAAWLVMEEMVRRGWLPEVEWEERTEEWHAWMGHVALDAHDAHAASAPLAICRAALKAFGTLQHPTDQDPFIPSGEEPHV